MKITYLFYSAFQVLKVYSYKKLMTRWYSYIVLFLVSLYHFFASKDIIFYNFSELNSKLYKNDFRRKFSFFNGITQTPQPFNDQYPLSWNRYKLPQQPFWGFLSGVNTPGIKEHLIPGVFKDKHPQRRVI